MRGRLKHDCSLSLNVSLQKNTAANGPEMSRFISQSKYLKDTFLRLVQIEYINHPTFNTDC